MELYINLKNCYGITSLEKELDFSNKSTFSIYASNGSMKTSFAKTFMDLSRGEESKDEIYPDRITTREIKKDEVNLEKEEVFVVKPYDKDYKSDDISALLVNPTLKKEYDKEYVEIQTQKDSFLREIGELSGIKKSETIEIEICNVFHQGEGNKFFESLARIKEEVLNDENPTYQDIKYNELFNDKTKWAIENKEFIKDINFYVEKYNELLEKSIFFKKGIFDHVQASDIASHLEKNGFFRAEHTVVLNGNNDPIKTKNDLEKIITEEKNKILQDEGLKKEFDKLTNILKKNTDTKKFRNYLSDNPQIVAELSNPDSLKAKLWKGYFKQHRANFKNLIAIFEKSKQTIDKIKKQADNEKGIWHNVISEFNDRFFVPFSLEVGNLIDVMLESKLPQIKFKFGSEDIEEKKLLEVLSQGEKRALYILNVLFEIEVRKKQENGCLLIMDDIADSFDYKNKYAIIEYIKEISEINNFYLIILTHNFDFHRSICSRLDMKREHKLNVVKTEYAIKMEQEIYQNSPLNHWRKNLDNPVMLFATIPMVRNLFEYSGKKCQADDITKFLHIKSDTENLTIEKIKELYEKCFDNQTTNRITNLEKYFYSFLIETCDQLGDEENLENKIILSIAIRLKAEEFMISKINDNDFVNDIETNQTRELFEKYENKFSENNDQIKVLKRVNLMTPENIHLNSFMYEPILDMSSDELKQLYQSVKEMI